MIDMGSFVLGGLTMLAVYPATIVVMLAYKTLGYCAAVIIAGLPIREAWSWVGGLRGIWSAETCTFGARRFDGVVVWDGWSLLPVRLVAGGRDV
jgi:hypothetical protein